MTSDIFDDVRDLDESVGEESAHHNRLGMVIAGVVAVATLAAVVMLVVIGFLPTGVLIALVLAMVVVAGILGFVVVASPPRRHKVRFAMAVMLSFLLVVMNLGIIKLSHDYLRFSSRIQASAIETVLYDIVVKAPGNIEVGDLAGTMMAEVENDPLGEAVRARAHSLVEVEFSPCESWSVMVQEVLGGDVASMVIQDAFLGVLQEVDEPAFDQLVIIASFEVDASRAYEPHRTQAPRPNDSFILYISGIDTYGTINSRARSDVNMLIVVNPTTSTILLVNTPRDYYVQFRGTNGLKDKLTHSGVYGIGVSLGTLEDLYGIDIDYYLRINFSSLIEVVDALGGVDVESAYDFHADGYHFHEGVNHLGGAAALAFSRHRYSFAGGDRVRGENQQRVIKGIIAKLTDPSVLSGYERTLSAVEHSLETSMPRSMISAQVRNQLSAGRAWQVESISVDGEGAMDYTYTYGEQRLYVMVPDQATVDAAIEKIRETMG
jgi:LCP family protein required for cell wall assembly